MTQPTRLHYPSKPEPLKQYARALFAKGTKQKEIQLPDIEALQTSISVDADDVARYSELCGFKKGDTLPLTYPHMLAFPLQMELMLHDSFPLALMGLVHIRNSITQHRAIAMSEVLDMRCYLLGSERTDKGIEIDIKSEASSGGLVVWESETRYLARRSNPNAAKKQEKEYPELPSFDQSERWILSSDLGRRYAAVSGDSNPIHLYALSAKLFGFKRHIAHGMWNKARTAAALYPKLGTDACTLTVEFKLPVFLPGRIELHHSQQEAGIEFDVRDIAGQKVHMKGELVANDASQA